MERLGTQLAWANEGLLYSGLQSCAPFRIHKKSFLHWTQNPILSICSSLSSSAIYKENHLWLTHNVFIIEDCVRYTGYPIIVFPDIVCSQVFLVTVVTMIVIYFFFIIIFHLKKIFVYLWSGIPQEIVCVVRKGDEGSLRPPSGDVALLFFHIVSYLFTWTYHMSTSWQCFGVQQLK